MLDYVRNCLYDPYLGAFQMLWHLDLAVPYFCEQTILQLCFSHHHQRISGSVIQPGFIQAVESVARLQMTRSCGYYIQALDLS